MLYSNNPELTTKQRVLAKSISEAFQKYYNQGKNLYVELAKVFDASFAPVDSTFIKLIDTPNSYSSHALKLVRVNIGATALEFTTSDIIITNLDGGHADSNYGATTPIDGGGA